MSDSRPAPPPIALTVAGSDSGGGAGVQADLKTFEAFGVFGTSVLTAVTAQNTRGVWAVHPIPVDVVRAQIDAVAEDLRPAAVKTGMLASAALIEAVAAGFAAHDLGPIVVDPVMVATSGDRLLDEGAETALVEHLLPRAALVTPNLPEAEILVGFEVWDETSMDRAARAIVDMGADAVLLKGGHLERERLVDLLWDGRTIRRWERERIDTRHTHGTGCTLSSAIAAGLALGEDLGSAVERALDYLERALRAAPGLGEGHGPVLHRIPVD